MMKTPWPGIRYILRFGVIEFRSGYPNPEFLPALSLMQATQVVLERKAWMAFTYRAEQGPNRLSTQMSARMQHREGEAPPSGLKRLP